jgi:hypothetical protein
MTSPPPAPLHGVERGAQTLDNLENGKSGNLKVERT